MTKEITIPHQHKKPSHNYIKTSIKSTKYTHQTLTSTTTTEMLHNIPVLPHNITTSRTQQHDKLNNNTIPKAIILPQMQKTDKPKNNNSSYTQTIGFPPLNTPQVKIHKFKIDNRNIFPKSMPAQEDVGKYGRMWPRGKIANNHPAAKILLEYCSLGCPVDGGKHWSHQQILQALTNGPHISAKIQRLNNIYYKKHKKYYKEATSTS